MPQSKYELVQQFYDRMGFSRPVVPSALDSTRRSQLMAYLLSEVMEFGSAPDLTEQVDAATDLLCFVMDVFVEMGVDPDVPFQLAWAANMDKRQLDGSVKFDYSVVPPRMLKPEGWEAPQQDIHEWLKVRIKATSNTGC